MSKRVLLYTLVLVLFMGLGIAISGTLTPQEQLGKQLFFDKNLSDPVGQACAACHGPNVGYTGPKSIINATIVVYPGAVHTRFGNRKPPAAAYAGDSPILYYDAVQGLWVGGMFWDGRATGWFLGDPLAEQAQGPFLNPLEQNNASPEVVVEKVLASNYQALFLQVCTDASLYYECIGRAIAAYERSKEVSPYTSKYDYWLKGQVVLTPKEQWGLALFEGKGKCAACHAAPVFTDFSYDNLGVPKNPLNPFYYEPEWNPAGKAWVDTGLGGFLESADYDPAIYEPERGKMKVPTLRNVAKKPNPLFVKAYAHNGYFKSLHEIVHFYNTRDVLGSCSAKKFPLPGINCWPQPEVSENLNVSEMGNLGLSSMEEDAIVAFLKTLSDGYTP
ncbi:MAG: Methylamine utilization protein MauG precursor [Syntrophorhabdus sp. PtaU1.Bin153]|nr:MAG: Methylamine utilization protein MauG precursor [Syntrophorhabdus sp. PtaU1.Bin153]